MKAAVVRQLALAHDLGTLRRAADAIAEREEEILPVEGDDIGERLTHLLLAARIRERIDRGEDPKEAFRAEMSAVRDVLTNG